MGTGSFHQGQRPSWVSITAITGSCLRNLPREPARRTTFATASPGDVFLRPAQHLHRHEATEDLPWAPSSFQRLLVHGPAEDCPSTSHSQRWTSQRSTSNFGNYQTEIKPSPCLSATIFS